MRLPHSAAVLAALLSLSVPATAAEISKQNPADLVGTYQVRLKHKDGSRGTGKLVIKPRRDGGLDLSGEVKGLGAVSTSAKANAHRFDLDAPRERDRDTSLGAAGRLGDELINPWEEEDRAEAERTHRFLTLSPQAQASQQNHGRYVQGTLTKNGETIAHLKLQRRNRVLVVHDRGEEGPERNTFSGYGRRVERYYGTTRGWDTVRVEVDSWDDVLAAVLAGWTEGHRFSRFVSISHSGWDGPLLSGQISSRSGWGSSRRWDELVSTFKRGLSPNAKAYISGCHAGGSNRYEVEDHGAYRWVVAVGKATGRTFAGPAGNTSTVQALRHTKATLEGIGTVRQEIWIAGPDGVRKIMPGGRLGTARRVPEPEPATK